ncbi:MAG TPA: MFS transporter [Steroidobacteraceae bacterium]|nr:MFS transporter [Steroidobacteraceae bacterium]
MKPVAFAAFQQRGFRMFFVGNATTMMADNVEHVISYWVMFQKFHSPELGGFAVISHWVPFLLFSGYSGALAARLDPRRMIQLGILLFMSVSLCWGVLIATGTLQIWHAAVLLSIHGCAGVLWGPPSQLLIHDIVGKQALPSAVRLTATSRYVGMLLGPAVGNALMLLLGPSHGIFANAAIYLPMLLWLWRAPYGPRFRRGDAPRLGVGGLADAIATLRSIRGNNTILSMTMLAGAVSFFVGNAYQAQMPNFATDLGHGDAGVSYAALTAADAAGALGGAIMLEARGLLAPRVGTAFILSMLWCIALSGFALTHSYPLALGLLFCAGFLELAMSAMTQALVQLNAPPQLRGHVIGVYAMAASGLRFVSGMTVGLLGGLLGVHASLSSAAGALLVVIALLFIWQRVREVREV